MASIAFVAACNALTGVSDLSPCTDCDDEDAGRAADAMPETAPAIVDSALPDAADAELASDAPTEAAAEAGIGCQGAADCTRVVFVTSQDYTGDLGGIAGANAKCQARADASPMASIHGRTFVAWVSTSVSAVTVRFVHGTKPYVRPDGVPIAASWDDLTDGNLANGISVNDLGGPKNGSDAWTGTTSLNAGYTGEACVDWTAATFTTKGTQGNVGGSGGGWSSSIASPCVTPLALYCFEY
jgi:ABC-type Fe3+ transport system substrate-binding protein